MTLAVVQALGLVTVQDLGRPGHMHEALAPGGALVPSLLVRANRRAGNRDAAAAIEVCGRLVVRAAGGDGELRVATDREVRVLGAGDELVVASDPHRVTYLAVHGGVAAPVILGGRGAHLSAGIGALVRAGDRIAPAGDAAASPPDDAAVGPSTGDIALVAGPDLDAFAPDALAALVASTYRVSPSSDRVGTRLEGPPIMRRADHVETSRPMVIGAIEVPRDGAPIVLGPEHPTTGGYPVIAVVAAAARDAFHAVRLGGTLRFRLA